MRLAILAAAFVASALASAALAAEATQPATQQQPQQTAAPTPAKQDPHDPNKVICKQVEEVGTRLGGQRVCMTRAQWNDEAWDNQHAMDDAQRHTTGVTGH